MAVIAKRMLIIALMITSPSVSAGLAMANGIGCSNGNHFALTKESLLANMVDALAEHLSILVFLLQSQCNFFTIMLRQFLSPKQKPACYSGQFECD